MKNELLLKNAKEKIRREMRTVNQNDPTTLIQDKLASALDGFCEQENNLAKKIIESKATFSDCCKKVFEEMKRSGDYSDENGYRKAVKFYMPDAEIVCELKIKTSSEVANISLMDLLEV